MTSVASEPKADHYFADATLAALYDAFCPRSSRRDFDFYLPFVMAARSVLDVGCGTGTLLHEARDAGHRGRLCGIDPAPGMIAQARKRSDIEWVLGDMTAARWDRAFDFVVMTGHAFQALVADDDIRASLAAIGRALTRGGRFAFETRNPSAREWEGWTPSRAATVTDAEGRRVRLARQVEVPFDGKVVSFTHTFTSPSWREAKGSRSTLRFPGVDALAVFLNEAGLVIDEQFGDWDRTPVTETSPEIITLVRPS